MSAPAFRRHRGAGRPGRARRGAVLPLVCVLLTVLIGGTALAVDLGRLYYVGQELQAAADASALAATAAVQTQPWKAWTVSPADAADLAARNRADGGPASVRRVEPVFYDPNTGTARTVGWTGRFNGIRVTTRARPRYALAQVFGITAPAITRTATAWVANVNGGSCVRPFALPYTRIYEDAHYMAHRPYSSRTRYAPDFTQAEVALLSPRLGLLSAAARTYVVVPPWEKGEGWDAKGQPTTGAWHTVNYGNAGYGQFTTNIGAEVGSPDCAGAVTQVDEYLRPFSWNRSYVPTLLGYIGAGFTRLCNYSGTAADASCRDAGGAVGVPTRVALADSIPNPDGPFTQKVRMITQMRVMCYFRSEDDVCPATIVTLGATTTAWQMPSATPGGPPVDKGYPAGTVVVLLDGPVSVDNTRDLTFGNTIGLTQRLLLVK